jgi:hypothetical protein
MSITPIALGVLAIIIGGFLLKKCGRALGALLLVLGVVTFGVWALIHSFQAFNGQTLVATVQASQVSNIPHEMAVELTTYSPDGTPIHSEYEVAGDLWMLQSQTIELQPYLTFVGFKSGYHLSRLSGEYNSSLAGSTPVQIGSWSWFNSLENNVKLFFPIVHSAYSSAVIDPTGTYNVCVDSAGDLTSERA